METYFVYILAAAVFLAVLVLSKFLLGWVLIREDQVGHVVKKLSSRQMPQGRIVALNGEAGYQARTLPPGLHLWLWPWMYRVDKRPIVTIEPGKIGLVVAKDGNALPADRILAARVECDNFQDAEAFLRNGGQRGKQSAVLTAGMFRINLVLFDVFKSDVTMVPPGKVGILTAMDGASMPRGQMAAPAVEGHKNYQEPELFIARGGCRGLQEQIILAGQYNLNPWFVEVRLAELYEVPIGHVGVVVSFVGSDEMDISGEQFTHGNIVPRGGKGVWSEPLYPGKHPLNTECMRVELVPTTNIVLNWANARSEAHKLDEKLSTITVRSRDGFTFNLDVSQIINIGATKAPWVISRVGSVKNLVNQVLEPLVGNYFRNSAQNYTVLDFLSARSDRQREAREHISKAILEYDVQSVDSLIGDITPPAALMDTLTASKWPRSRRRPTRPSAWRRRRARRSKPRRRWPKSSASWSTRSRTFSSRSARHRPPCGRLRATRQPCPRARPANPKPSAAGARPRPRSSLSRASTKRAPCRLSAWPAPKPPARASRPWASTTACCRSSPRWPTRASA